MQKQSFIVKGNIVYSRTKQELSIAKDSYLVCDNAKVAGVFSEIPDQYKFLPVQDMQDAIIIPGLVDLHLHAPQYSFRGIGMDMELLDWLNHYTFPEEAKYEDLAYAKRAYAYFVEDLKNGATTRANIFATIHTPATLLLMEMLEESGLVSNVGKVNMDRNSPPNLCETSAQKSIEDTKEWVKRSQEKFENTKPILTPRFVPSCTDALLDGLGGLQKQTSLPVQSHLSENPEEIEWVKSLCPNSRNYADAYLQHGLLGGENNQTVMAHCVHSGPEERALLKKQGVFVAHCPNSNTSLASGIAPIREYLQDDIKVGLGTDIAGGYSASIFDAMAQAIQVSKLYWRLVDSEKTPLTVAEAFYLATKGGGKFFGEVGSFEEGYAFDAVVLDDKMIACPFEATVEQRLERLVYLFTPQNVIAKYVNGVQVK